MYVWERHLGSSSSGEEFEDSYRGHARVELTGLFASDRKRLLDVGCASGATSALLKELIPGLEAWGVEPDPVAAQLAARRLDKVFAKKLEDVDLLSEGLRHGDIDAVLLADVLEHMYDPWRALMQLKPFLAADAQVVISLPNVRNVGLVSDLVDGRFDYQKWGLLDITHIRFFTLDGAVRMLQETGYGVRRVQANIDPMLGHILAAGVPADGTLKFDRMSVSSVEPRELVEMCALQFFIVASPVQLEVVWGGAPSQEAETSVSDGGTIAEQDGGDATGGHANSGEVEAVTQSHVVEVELDDAPADNGDGGGVAEPAMSDGSGSDATGASVSEIVADAAPATSNELMPSNGPHDDLGAVSAAESAGERGDIEEAAPVKPVVQSPEHQSQPDDDQGRRGN
jgi:SAM-dependent methyltransferase